MEWARCRIETKYSDFVYPTKRSADSIAVDNLVVHFYLSWGPYYWGTFFLLSPYRLLLGPFPDVEPFPLYRLLHGTFHSIPYCWYMYKDLHVSYRTRIFDDRILLLRNELFIPTRSNHGQWT
jgi:hypothetical protein